MLEDWTKVRGYEFFHGNFKSSHAGSLGDYHLSGWHYACFIAPEQTATGNK